MGQGNAITTGSKNAILGAYTGNQHSLDIRTSSNNIVLSDGDGNPRQVINSSAQVGMGTVSPSANLHVNSSGNTSIKISSSFSGSTTTGLFMDTVGDTSAVRLNFAKSGTTRGLIGYSHSAVANSEAITFSTAATLRARIDGDGLKFGSDTAAANALDDYEEGTWTPIYSPATAFTSITYDGARGGSYTKVGNVVHIRGALRTDAINGGSGQVKIGGLPFTSSSSAPLGTFSIGYLNNFSGDFPGGIYVNGGATTATITYRTGANTGLDNDLQVADLNTGGNANYILFSGSYYVS